MSKLIQLGNIFLKYEKLSIKDFLLSNVWVEYHLPDELDIFRKNGATEDWIYKYIYEYEELKKGNASIYYTIIGDDFYFNKEFINIKSIMVINNRFYYIGYQFIIKTNKRQPKGFCFVLKNRERTFYYLTDIFKNENKKVFNSISADIQEYIESVIIYTEKNYRGLILPKATISLESIVFSNVE